MALPAFQLSEAIADHTVADSAFAPEAMHPPWGAREDRRPWLHRTLDIPTQTNQNVIMVGHLRDIVATEALQQVAQSRPPEQRCHRSWAPCGDRRGLCRTLRRKDYDYKACVRQGSTRDGMACTPTTISSSNYERAPRLLSVVTRVSVGASRCAKLRCFSAWSNHTRRLKLF